MPLPAGHRRSNQAGQERRRGCRRGSGRGFERGLERGRETDRSGMNMPEVKHLFLCKIHRFPMEEVEEALAVYEQGLKGCIHGRKGSSRQISLMDSETLARFGLAPGAVKENITTVGMDFQTLAAG